MICRIFILLMIVSWCGAATVHVPQDYPDIKPAIAAAKDGDTIEFGAGQYGIGFDNVGIITSRTLTLRAADPLAFPTVTVIPGHSRLTFQNLQVVFPSNNVSQNEIYPLPEQNETLLFEKSRITCSREISGNGSATSRVELIDCVFTGTISYMTFSDFQNVLFSRCQLYRMTVENSMNVEVFNSKASIFTYRNPSLLHNSSFTMINSRSGNTTNVEYVDHATVQSHTGNFSAKNVSRVEVSLFSGVLFLRNVTDGIMSNSTSSGGFMNDVRNVLIDRSSIHGTLNLTDVEYCEVIASRITGSSGSDFNCDCVPNYCFISDGQSGIKATNVTNLNLLQCQVAGGRAGGVSYEAGYACILNPPPANPPHTTGGSGLELVNTNVVAVDTSFKPGAAYFGGDSSAGSQYIIDESSTFFILSTKSTMWVLR